MSTMGVDTERDRLSRKVDELQSEMDELRRAFKELAEHVVEVHSKSKEF